MEYLLKDLILDCKEGSKTAKEEVLERLRPLIMASIKKYYYGSEPYEDLLQDGYMKTLAEIERFDEVRGVPFLGFIKQQLRYFYMDKGRKSTIEISLNNLILEGDGTTEFIDMIPDDGPAIEDLLMKEETDYALGQALESLTEKQRRVLMLHYGHGMSFVKIAGKLDVHYQTVIKTRDVAFRRIKVHLSF
ncbi:RNA polymerase sigma factor [Anaerosolibacter sp.]|uniref:RNA polymerase sigma factor n=1 Tax=Anaerosolibacter sp. TaxID=1872527 RepID=UPI0039F0C889